MKIVNFEKHNKRFLIGTFAIILDSGITIHGFELDRNGSSFNYPFAQHGSDIDGSSYHERLLSFVSKKKEDKFNKALKKELQKYLGKETKDYLGKEI